MHIIKYLFPTLPSGTYGNASPFGAAPARSPAHPAPAALAIRPRGRRRASGWPLLRRATRRSRSAGHAAALAPPGPRTGVPAAFLSRTERMCGRFGPAMAGPLLQPPAWIPPPPPGAWINQGTAWGWGGLRPPSLLAKTKDSVAGFCCAEKQTKKGGPRNSPARQPPPVTAAVKK